MALLGTLFFALWRSKHNQSDKPRHPEADNKDAKPQAQMALTTNTVPTPPNSGGTDGIKKGTPLWEKLAVLTALGILIMNTWQSCATQKQTKLMHQQLAGTQGVTIDAQIEVEAPSSNTVHFLLVNKGLVTMNGLHAKAEASKVLLMSDNVVIDRAEILFDRMLPPTRAGETALNEPYTLPDGVALEQDWDHFVGEGKTVQIVLDLGYDNGFGDPVHLSICRRWLPRRTGMPYGLIPCDDLQSLLKRQHAKKQLPLEATRR